MLIRALEVEVARVTEIRPGFDDGATGGAGIEPHIENIGFLGKLGAAALGAGEAFRQDLAGVLLKPCVRAFRQDQVAHGVDGVPVQDLMPALGAVEDGDPDAPGALARETPIRPAGNHGVDAVDALLGDPFDALDRHERALAQFIRIDAHEPLHGGTEDGGLVATPAVGILVLQRAFMEQCPALAQHLEHRGVPLLQVHSGELAGLVGEAPLIINRAERGQAVRLAKFEVLAAVPGRRMHHPGAGIHGDVRGSQEHGVSVDKGVAEDESCQIGARVGGDHLHIGDADGLHRRLQERLGEQVIDVAHARHDVLLIGVNCHGEVRWERPRCGRPDDGVAALPRGVAKDAVGIPPQRKANVDRGRGVGAILHLRLRQRGLVVRAPVYRLQTAVDEALLGELAEDIDHLRLEGVIHREVGV